MTTNVLPTVSDIDPLAEVAVRLVTSRQLREGMVILDADFDVPVAVLDQRVGNGTWNVHMVDGSAPAFRTGERFPISSRPTIRVAADLRVA